MCTFADLEKGKVMKSALRLLGAGILLFTTVSAQATTINGVVRCDVEHRGGLTQKIIVYSLEGKTYAINGSAKNVMASRGWEDGRSRFSASQAQELLQEGLTKCNANTSSITPPLMSKIDVQKKERLSPVNSSSTQSMTAEWVKVGGDDTQTAYYDPATIRKEGNKVTMWVMYDNKRVNDILGEQFLSEKVKEGFDCKKKESAGGLHFSLHSEHMGRGITHHNEAGIPLWRPVTPDSRWTEDFFKIACGKNEKQQTVALNLQEQAKAIAEEKYRQLTKAVEAGDIETTKRYIAAGLDVNGGNAVSNAAGSGQCEILKLLLDAGGKPDPDF